MITSEKLTHLALILCLTAGLIFSAFGSAEGYSKPSPAHFSEMSALIRTFSPGDGPAPLPEDCDGVGTADDPNPTCCAHGYVYDAGQPVADAEVVIISANGRYTTTTTPGNDSGHPYYSVRLSREALQIEPGDTITVTATYANRSATHIYQVVAGSQQVDAVIPADADDQPPISTINYIQPSVPGPGPETITFAGAGADADTAGVGIVAWEWTSDRDGELSDRNSFTRPITEFSGGVHAISLRVQDDEGGWSTAVEREVEIVEFDLAGGWHVIMAAGKNYDAATFMEEIADQGGEATRMRYWRTDLGTWVSYTPERPLSPFPLMPGAPYFVEVDAQSQLRLFADAKARQCKEIVLNPGWNFVTYPLHAPPQAPEEACLQIAEQGGNVEEIVRWNRGWVSYTCGAPIGNAPFAPGEGVFVKTFAGSTWAACDVP